MVNPFLSVVVPFCNASRHLAAAIDSLCSQRYGNFEIVLVDDGSVDDSRAIASSFLGRDVSLLCQSNQGVGAAFNAGLRVTRGEIVFLHGADDLSHPDRMRRCVDLFRSEGADVVTCRPDLIDGEGMPITPATFPVFERDCDTGEPFAVFTSLFFLENFICAPATAVTRRLLDRLGPVHGGLIQLQDFDYWLRAAAVDERFHVDPVPWLSYRRHDGNISRLGNLPRSFKETQLVYRRLAPLLTREAALRLLAARPPRMLDIGMLHDAPASALTALAYIAHTNSNIRQIGYEILLAALDRREEASYIDKQLGLSAGRVFEMVGADA